MFRLVSEYRQKKTLHNITLQQLARKTLGPGSKEQTSVNTRL